MTPSNIFAGTLPLRGPDPDLEYLVLCQIEPSDDARARLQRLAAVIDRKSGLQSIDLPSRMTRLWVRSWGIDHCLASNGRLVLVGSAWDRSGHQVDQTTLDALAPADLRGVAATHWGRYLAIAMPGDGSTRVLRDPLGTCQAYRTQKDGIAIVAPTLPGWLVDASHLKLRPDLSTVAELLADPRVAIYRSMLTGLDMVPPGRPLNLTNGHIDDATWSPARIVAGAPKTSDAEARDRLRAAVDLVCGAVSERHRELIVQLSGGLDSTIVLGTLARQRDPATIAAVNFATPYREGDERGMARTAAIAAGVTLQDEVADPERLDLASFAGSAQPWCPAFMVSIRTRSGSWVTMPGNAAQARS